MHAGGAEESDVFSLRNNNKRSFDGGVTMTMIDPMTSMIYFRYFHNATLDNFMFAHDEAALKSPFTWPKALIAPGVLASQYAWHFFDTNPLVTVACVTSFLFSDFMYWVGLSSLFGGTYFLAHRKAIHDHHDDTYGHLVGDIASAELRAFCLFFIGRVATMLFAAALAYVNYAASHLLPNSWIDALFAFQILTVLITDINAVAHVLHLTALTDVLDPISSYIVKRLGFKLAVGASAYNAAIAAAPVDTAVFSMAAAKELHADVGQTTATLITSLSLDDHTVAEKLALLEKIATCLTPEQRAMIADAKKNA